MFIRAERSSNAMRSLGLVVTPFVKRDMKGVSSVYEHSYEDQELSSIGHMSKYVRHYRDTLHTITINSTTNPTRHMNKVSLSTDRLTSDHVTTGAWSVSESCVELVTFSVTSSFSCHTLLLEFVSMISLTLLGDAYLLNIAAVTRTRRCQGIICVFFL